MRSLRAPREAARDHVVAEREICRRSKPTPAGCGRCCTTCCATRSRRWSIKTRRASRSRRASAPRTRDLVEIKVADNGPGLLARHRASSLRAVRHEQAQRNGPRPRDRQEARRRARRPDQRAQPRAGRSRDQYTHPDIGRRGRSIAHSAPRSQERTRMSARILVVDDEANIRALIDEILSEEGYDVTTAADAKEARSARKRHEFDLILLDIWMPDTDGISLLREWSEGGATGTVVMMSGHGTVDTAVEATRLGAVDFVEKPVSLAKLLRTVERALAVRRNKEQRRGVAAQNVAPGRQEPTDTCAARADRARRAAQRAHLVHGRARQRPRAVRALSREPERAGARPVRRRDGRRSERRERATRAARRRHGARRLRARRTAESCSFRSSARSAAQAQRLLLERPRAGQLPRAGANRRPTVQRPRS